MGILKTGSLCPQRKERKYFESLNFLMKERNKNIINMIEIEQCSIVNTQPEFSFYEFSHLC